MAACETLQPRKISYMRARRIVLCAPCLPAALLQGKMNFFEIQNSVAMPSQNKGGKGPSEIKEGLGSK